jgi:hypothetical protein
MSTATGITVAGSNSTKWDFFQTDKGWGGVRWGGWVRGGGGGEQALASSKEKVLSLHHHGPPG